MKTITSAANPSYKLLRKLLHSSRSRKEEGVSLLDGVHLVQAYSTHVGAPKQIAVSITGLARREIRAVVENLSTDSILVLSDSLFSQLSSVETPTGILGVIETPQRRAVPKTPGPCVMLEDIQDPGNMGSILRTAAAAGIKEAFLSSHCVHAWSPRVLRAGMGAHFVLAIYEQVDLAPLASGYKGKVLAADQRAARTIYDSDLTGNVALLLGNEGSGLSKGLQNEADEALAIPMRGGTESLNVAAAAAVFLFERVRQLRAPNPRSPIARPNKSF